MIGAVIVLTLLAAGCWWLYHSVKPATVGAAATTQDRTDARGPEDAPEGLPHGSWTALDELQMTRMLTESAPPVPPVQDSTDQGSSSVRENDPQ